MLSADLQPARHPLADLRHAPCHAGHDQQLAPQHHHVRVARIQQISQAGAPQVHAADELGSQHLPLAVHGAVHHAGAAVPNLVPQLDAGRVPPQLAQLLLDAVRLAAHQPEGLHAQQRTEQGAMCDD
jgi:hypothetical protein